jgi:acetylornithine deacetylase/succinyl-diaminopimelate desuccinylase-like protein
MTDLSTDVLKKWFKEHYEKTLADFFTFLSFPSISTDPTFHPDCRKAADWLCRYMKEIGLETTIWETSGLPVVFGEYKKAGANAPTLLIYHHYDVQPVDPIELWKSDPFKPVIRENQVFARGASDNKGQCFYSLTAIKAFLSLAKELPCNLKVFIEGEEETGGKGTAEVLQQKKAELKADHLLIVDSGIPSISSPAITLGVRGIVTMDVECSNSSVDLHSGIHGGIALNPNRALATLLAGMWDENGKVVIPGFYDDLLPLSKEDSSLVDMTFDQEHYEKSFGVTAYYHEKGFSFKEANWLRPVLEINGISGGYTGLGFKTVIPAKAHAKISCRLVPNQDPFKVGEAIKQHLLSSAPKGIKVSVNLHHGTPAFRSDFNYFIVKTSALAYEDVFKKPCRYCLAGGTVPIVDLVKASGAQATLIGVDLESDAIHSPNEHFGLDRLELGFLTIGRILSRLS